MAPTRMNSPRRQGRSRRLAIEQLEARLVPASFAWNTDSDGAWDNGANWFPMGVPGAGDTVTIDRGAANPTVTVTDSRTVGQLSLSERLVIQSGVVTCAGSWTLNDDNNTVRSTLEIAQGGTLKLQGGSIGGNHTATFSNSGTIVVGAGIQSLNGMLLQNLPAGVVSWEDGATLQGNSHLVNQGLFLKPAGSGTSVLTKTWSNRGGTIQVDAGTLEMTSSMGDVSGMQVVVAADSKAFLSGTLSNWSGAITGSGAGIVQFGDALRAANITLSATDGSGTHPANATFNFPENMLVVRRGAISSVFESGVGEGTLVNSGFIRFEGESGSETSLDTIRITNNGTVAFAQSGNFNFRNTYCTNETGGIINLATDGTFSATVNANGLIINKGSLVKTAGTGTSLVSLVVQFEPGGVVEARTGTLQLNGIVTVGGILPTSHGGTFIAASGATVLLTGTHRLQGTYTGSGLGTLQFGPSNPSAIIELIHRDTDGVDKPTEATFNFPPNFAHFHRVDIRSVYVADLGVGTLANTGAITLDAIESGHINTSTININNSGSLLFSHVGQATLINTTLTNLPGGVIDFQADNTLSGNSLIDNHGLIVKSSGTGTSLINNGTSITVRFQSDGTVEARTGTLQIFGNSETTTTSQGGTFIAANGATVLLNGTHRLQGTYTGSGLGTLQFGTSNSAATIHLIHRDTDGVDKPTEATFNFPPNFAHFRRGTLQSLNVTGLGVGTLANTGAITFDAEARDHININTINFNNSGSLLFSHVDQAVLSNATLTNFTGGVIDFQADNSMGGNGLIDNHGTLRRSAGAFGTTLSVATNLQPRGSVEIGSGILELAGAGTLSGCRLAIASGAGISLTGSSNQTLAGNFTASGAGTFTLTRTVYVDTTGISLDFPRGMLHLVGGGFRSSNDNLTTSVVNRGFLSIDSGGGVRKESGLTRVKLVNQGTVTVDNARLRIDGGGWDASVLNTGTIELGDSGEVGRESGPVTNRGRIVRTGPGTSFFYGTLDNQGTVDVSEGTLVFSQNGTTRLANYSTANGGTLTGGTWKVSGDGAIDLGTLDNSIDPVARLAGATVIVEGTGARLDGLASLKFNAGTLNLTGGADLNLATNDLNNAGLIRLGSGSVLAVKSFTQAASGGLALGIGGLPGDGKFGQITSVNGATLAGGLKVEIEGGYGISPGADYPMVQAPGFTGSFDTVGGLTLGRSRVMELREETGSRTVRTLLPAPDIAASAVSGPGTGLVGENATVGWTVTNLGGTDAGGTWADTVYLSADDALDQGDIALGRVEHTGGLAAGANYSASLTARIPAMSGSYKFLVVADGQGRLTDIDRANNAAASSAPAAVSYRTIDPDATQAVALSPGGVAYRQVTLPAGMSLAVDTSDKPAIHLAFSGSGAPDLATRVPATEGLPVLAGPGTFVVAIVAGPGYTGTGVSVTAAVRQLSVTGIATPRAGVGGMATIAIKGSAFQPGLEVSLVDPTGVLPALAATAVRVTGESALMATFNLAGAQVGRRQVRVALGAAAATSPSTVDLTPSAAASFSARVITPESVRPRVPFDARVLITNTGANDALVPLLALSQSAPFKFVKSGDGWMDLSDTLPLVANPGDGRNFLRPGESLEIPFKAYADTSETHVHDTITLSVIGADSQAAFDPAVLRASFDDYGSFPAAAVNLLVDRAGTTLGGYASWLGGIAAGAASLGVSTCRVDELLQAALGDITARDILANARGRLEGLSAGQLRSARVFLDNLVTGESYPGFVALDGTLAFHQVPRGYYALSSPDMGLVSTSIVLGAAEAALGTIRAVPFRPLQGTVIDSATGRALSGVEVTASTDGGSQATTTDSRGRYTLLLDPVFDHELVFSHPAFVDAAMEIPPGREGTLDISLHAGGTLSGTVRLAGLGAGNVTVTLTGADGSVFRSAVTSAEGAYSIAGIAPGHYELAASASGKLSEPVAVEFGPAQSAIGSLDLALVQAVALSGTVSDANPVAGAVVYFLDSTGRATVATTDDLGRYSLSLLPGKTGTLVASHRGHLETRLADVATGAADSTSNITLVALGSVSGTVFVTDSTATRTVGGAFVQIRSAATGGIIAGQTTSPTGAYSFAGLPDGSYLVEWAGDNAQDASAAVTIADHAAVTGLSILARGCVIRGMITGAGEIGGEGIPYSVILAGSVVTSGRTDPTGRYAVHVKDPGAYLVAARSADDTVSFREVTVAPGDFQTLDMNLAAGSPSRPLLVLDPAGNPLAGQVVEATGQASGYSLRVTTDASGQARFTGLAPEAYSLSIVGTGFGLVLGPASLAGTDSLTLGTTATGTVAVTATSFGTALQTGDEIRLVSQSGNFVAVGFAPEGAASFTMANIPGGTYRGYLVRDGIPIAMGASAFAITAGQAATLPETFLEIATTRSFKVLDNQGRPVNGALVRALAPDGQVLATGVTGVTGAEGQASLRVPDGFTGLISVSDFQAVTTVASDFRPGADGIVTVQAAGLALMLVPMPDDSVQRGGWPSFTLYPEFKDFFTNPFTLLPPLDDPSNPCYGELLHLYGLAAQASFKFHDTRDRVAEQWEALNTQDQSKFYELTARSINVALNMLLALKEIGGGINSLTDLKLKDPWRNILPDNPSFPNIAEIRAEAAHYVDSIHRLLIGDIKNQAEAFGAKAGDAINGTGLSDGTIKAMANIPVDILMGIASEFKTFVTRNSHMFAATFLAPLNTIFDQIKEVYNIKEEAEDLVGDLSRFELISNAVDAHANAYRRAHEAVRACKKLLSDPDCAPKAPPVAPLASGTAFRGPETQTPHDPNDILGPEGVGAPRFVGPDAPLAYTIRFENSPVAPATTVAPAAIVTLTQQLDADLDPASVRFVGAGFASVNLSFSDARFIHQRYDDRAVSGLFVDLDGYVDAPSRTIHWSFTSIDPATGEPPADASLGFLAMNNAAHAGEGYITYSVLPAAAAANDTRIDAQASIVFDTNDAIPTPAIFNTLDRGAPVPGTLAIATMAGQSGSADLVLLGARPVTLSWSAAQDAGAGANTHTLQVSTDGGSNYADVVANTTASSATFTTVAGTTYLFRLLATDQVANTTPGAGASLASLHVTASATAIAYKDSSGSLAVAAQEGSAPFLTRPSDSSTALDILGSSGASNTLTIDRAAQGAFGARLRFLGGETAPVPPSPTSGIPPMPDFVVIRGLADEDASFKLTGYQAVSASLGSGDLRLAGAGSVTLTSARSLLLQTSGGSDYPSLSNFGTTTTFFNSGNSAGTSINFSGVPSVTLDMGAGDTAADKNLIGIRSALAATGLKSLAILGGAGSDTLSLNEGSSTTLPVPGGTFSFQGGSGTDTINAFGNTNWTLGNSLVRSAAGHNLVLGSVESALILGGIGNNTIDASQFTGKTQLGGGLGNDIIKGGKGHDTLYEFLDRATTLTLTPTRLTGLGTDTLSGIENADLTGSPGNDTFDLSKFTLTATIQVYSGGTDTVKGSAGVTTISAADYSSTKHAFTLTQTRLTHPSGIVNFTSTEAFDLAGGSAANTFDVSSYTGKTTLHGNGGADTVIATRDASFTLSNTLLTVSGGGTHTLDGVTAARLTGGAGANTFTLGAWTGQATLNASTGADLLVASGDFNFTLGASSLAISSGAAVAFAGFEKARLSGGVSANTLDASLFAGSVQLFGNDGNDTLRGAKGASALMGGNGADSLTGGSGRAILIGGTGADTFTGGAADDLLIHGATRHDASVAAIDALLAEWSRTTATYAQRVSHLRTGTGGLNGATRLTGAILDDLAVDTQMGGRGQDWFFARVASSPDLHSDRATNEYIN